jgi:hypothetical protein
MFSCFNWSGICLLVIFWIISSGVPRALLMLVMISLSGYQSGRSMVMVWVLPVLSISCILG